MKRKRITIWVLALWAFILRAAQAISRASRYPVWLRTQYAPIAGGDDVEGARGTANVNTDVLEVDFSDTILELDEDVTPLLIMTKRLAKDVVVNPTFNWFEDGPEVRFDRVNDATPPDDNDTTIIVDNEDLFHPDDIVYVSRTGEQMRVTDTDSGASTIDVVRGVGSTAAALLDNDELIITSSAAMQGSLDKPAHSDNPVKKTNYTQIFRDPYEMTGTARSTANRTRPHDWNRQANKKSRKHAKDIEFASMLGQSSIDTTGAQPRTTTGGFNEFATQNITDVGGVMTENEFYNAISPVFRHGKVKLAIAARVPVDVLNTFARSKVQVLDTASTYGVRVVQVISPHGTLNFVTHWLMEGDELSKQIWLVDLNNCGYRYLHGDGPSRDTKIRENIQDNGSDGRKDEILTECGFVWGNAETHGRIINITG